MKKFLLLSLLALLPAMAHAVTGSRQSGMCANTSSNSTPGTGTANSSYPYRCGLQPTVAGNSLVVVVWAGTSTNAELNLTVTDQQNDPFALSFDKYDTSNGNGLWFYCAPVSTSGSTWIQFSPATGGASLYYVQAAYLEMSTNSCTVDKAAGTADGGGSSMTPGSVTTTANGDLLLNAVGNGNANKFSSIATTTGWTAADIDLFNGAASGFALQYEIQATAAAINPAVSEGANDGAWSDSMVAYEPATGGTGAGAFQMLNVFHGNYWIGSGSNSIGSVTFDVPNQGGFEVLLFDGEVSNSNTQNASAVSDNNGDTWYHLAGCDSNDQGADVWYAFVTGAPIQALQVTVTLSPSSPAPADIFMFYDIAGVNATAPIDTGIGSKGAVCVAGLQTSYASSLTFFTETVTHANEILLFHANQDYNDAIGISSPSAATYLSTQLYGGGNFNYTVDESANNAICSSCAAGSTTYTGLFNDATGRGENNWIATMIGVQPAASITLNGKVVPQ